jgi:N-acetyl-gamma-glutamyl-phosphate reductase
MQQEKVMLKVAIIGASGYTGGELLRLLVRHPKVQITAVTSEQSAGKPVTALFPNLVGRSDLVFEPLHLEDLSKKADFFFVALPHTTAMACAAPLIGQGKRVVDLSADFRLKDPQVYQQWYQTPHAHPDLLRAAVYGLPELHRKAIQKAALVANPGCYPTGALLGLLPLIKGAGSVKGPLIHLDGIVIDAKSGVTGAGRNPAMAYHFPEVNESASAYNVASHRHQPEIEQEISALVSQSVLVAFTPHLLPMSRGILTTLYARMRDPREGLGGIQIFKDFYKNEPFVQVLPAGQWPNTRNVRGSNACHIGLAVDPRTDRIIVVTVIDNLMKGAAGQAVQNMNLMMGFEETLGLDAPALFP